MINFNIERWQAWAPGLACADAWAKWSLAPCCPADPELQPDVAFLPPLLRRRMSRLARMIFAIAAPLAEDQPRLPLVYASRHGEISRNFSLLSDLARSEPLSPTQFSLSVHNAIAGLWSIQRGDTSEMTALAAEGDGLEHAVIEASLLLDEGAPAVLLLIAEEQPPEPYRAWIDDVPFPYALGLLLKPGTDWQLSLTAADTDMPAARWPHALQLVRALHTTPSHFTHQWKTRRWNWQRTR
ncbi:beta-ketoacyl synthase chain length factor [Stutzerimonas stutzeri]|uniref:beta-ketoacyl synthase chain length factor n=1 Tax=Stutzerimonas sp. S1 TaxID=3030652 RepID=UPI002225383A|nr:beta-ketoacyl synthase chain length factor [Stutzerimonas sp. S1]